MADPLASTSIRITDYLVGQHEEIGALLDRATDGGVFDPEAFAGFRREILRHVGIEEKILFPAVRRAQGRPIALSRTLREEHAALTSLLVPTPDLALCAEIRALLRVHEAKEEATNGAYAECDAVLSPELSAQLAREAAGYPPVAVVRHFDGHGTHRTAAAALAAAARMRPTRAAG